MKGDKNQTLPSTDIIKKNRRTKVKMTKAYATCLNKIQNHKKTPKGEQNQRWTRIIISHATILWEKGNRIITSTSQWIFRKPSNDTKLHIISADVSCWKYNSPHPSTLVLSPFFLQLTRQEKLSLYRNANETEKEELFILGPTKGK